MKIARWLEYHAEHDKTPEQAKILRDAAVGVRKRWWGPAGDCVTRLGVVVVQCNGFVGSAMASAPDGTGVTSLTVETTRAWAQRTALELGVEIEDRIATAGARNGREINRHLTCRFPIDRPDGLRYSYLMNSATTTQAIEIETLRDRDHKFHGRNVPGEVSEGHRAEIVVGESITLHGVDTQRRARPTLYANVFRIGDVAAVGGYNLTYTGIVRAITAKTVTVVEYEGTCNEKTYKLSIFRFDRKNWDFDAHETAKRNSEWMN